LSGPKTFGFGKRKGRAKENKKGKNDSFVLVERKKMLVCFFLNFFQAVLPFFPVLFRTGQKKERKEPKTKEKGNGKGKERGW